MLKYNIYNKDGGLIEVIRAENSADVMDYIEKNYFSGNENFLGITFANEKNEEDDFLIPADIRRKLK